MNEKKIQWVENEDWEYRTSFIVSEEQLNRDGIQLILKVLIPMQTYISTAHYC